ncbi:MAG: hypothetical protein V4643_06185 [Bacteroidota bacterium]
MPVLLFLLLCFCNQLCAQDFERGFITNSTIGNPMSLEVNQYYLPAYRYINVYSRPDVQSKVFTKTQSFADSLKVVEVLTGKYSKFKNVYGQWCKVTFPLKGKRFFGYVPSQFLAPLQIKQGTKTYLVFIEKYQKGTFIFSLKVLNKFNLISEHTFKAPANEHYSPVETDTIGKALSGYLELSLFNNKGLDSVEHVIKVSGGIDACGYWNGTKILLLRDNRVIKELEEGSVGDADIYHEGYSYLFPADSLGEKNMFIKDMWYSEAVDDTFTNTWDARVKYKWFNNHLIKIDSVYSSKRINTYLERNAE